MLKILFCSTCISLLTLFSNKGVYAADYFTRALKIFSEGKLFEASIEFERAIFYETDSNRIAQYKYYKSLCYRGLGKYNGALVELNNINMKSLPDSLVLVVRYEKILCSYLKKDLNQALRNIDEVAIRYQDTLKIREFIPLEILCLNSCRQWDNALKLWKYYINNSQIQDSDRIAFKYEIEKLYNKQNIPKIYSPEKAARLSVFLPGLGQIYCGAVIEGSLSFLFNAASLSLAVMEFYNKYYLTGYFFVDRLFGRFYRGGINRAIILAGTRSEEQLRKFNTENSAIMIRMLNCRLPEISTYVKSGRSR